MGGTTTNVSYRHQRCVMARNWNFAQGMVKICVKEILTAGNKEVKDVEYSKEIEWISRRSFVDIDTGQPDPWLQCSY